MWDVKRSSPTPLPRRPVTAPNTHPARRRRNGREPASITRAHAPRSGPATARSHYGGTAEKGEGTYRPGRASAAAAAIDATRPNIGIGSVPTDPGNTSATRSGVHPPPSAYTERSSTGWAQTAIFGPATV